MPYLQAGEQIYRCYYCSVVCVAFPGDNPQGPWLRYLAHLRLRHALSSLWKGTLRLEPPELPVRA